MIYTVELPKAAPKYGRILQYQYHFWLSPIAFNSVTGITFHYFFNCLLVIVVGLLDKPLALSGCSDNRLVSAIGNYKVHILR